MRAAGLLATIAAVAAACAREPAEAVCPPLAAGDLVVTELRGPAPQDALGSWIELYNASGAAIDLAGIRIDFTDFQKEEDESAVLASVLVRRSLVAEAGAYLVLGMFDDIDPPAHVDYGFRADYIQDREGGWLRTARVRVQACDTVVDRVSFGSLPMMGTHSLGGAPDAARNDLDASWCNDATQVGPSFPGTPKTRNIACP